MRVLSMIYITALMQEAAIGLPPFVPVTVIYGTFDSAINKSFDSAAPTKPRRLCGEGTTGWMFMLYQSVTHAIGIVTIDSRATT